MAQTANFTWGQGEDLSIALIYKEGAVGSEVVVDLSSGYAVRMDLVVPATKERIYTFNSEAIADVDPITSGAQADSIVEGALTNGAGGTANITISIPRALTLPGGAIYTKLVGTPAVSLFGYDIFLRNKTADKQVKILTGTIAIDGSSTLWL